ncbi:MAG: DUF5110 domain-containing protein, partial [Telluria sp.]
PYTYTLAFENSMTGMPLMRPLMFEEPGNPALRGECGTYLWGREFLVSPVVEPGLSQKQIYFPRTSAWFDFYTEARHAGGHTETVTVVPGHIPVFVRAGAFVPMAPPMQSTCEYTGASLELHYYHDASVTRARGSMYHDDGETPDAHARGRYELLHFAAGVAQGELALTITSELGSEQLRAARTIAVTVHGLAARPRGVLIEREEAPCRWDPERRLLRVELPDATDAVRSLVLRLASSKPVHPLGVECADLALLHSALEC